MENLVITKNEKSTILFLSIWIFLVFREKLTFIDNNIYSFFIGFKTDLLTNIVRLITNIGGAYVLVTIAFLILIFVKNKKVGWFVSLNLILSYLLNEILKRIFRRNRPLFTHLVKESGFSFPSGHAMVSFCFYGLIIFLIHRSKLKYKKYYEGLLSILILIIGSTRIYLGVHYFSDIIAGFGFGLLYLLFFIRFFKLK